MFPKLSLIFLVALGGAAGSVSRYVSGFILAQLWGTGYPYGTFFVNLAGSFLIGLLSSLLLLKYPNPKLAAFFIAGFLGGFTTFSSFMNECAQFLAAGHAADGFFYMALQLAGGLAAVFLGAALGRWAVLS